MDEASRKYARKILFFHIALFLAVVALVIVAANDIYEKARAQALDQAKSRQALLANQTARGIESFYESILSDLELLGNDESATTRPVDRLERIQEIRDNRPPAGAGPRSNVPRYGTLLWQQLRKRASVLFIYDKETKETIPLGSIDETISAAEVVQQTSKWMESVEKASISKYQKFGNIGANLLCVPQPRNKQRMFVAVVPIPEIESRFLNSINADHASAAFLVDETMVAMAASSPPLVGISFKEIEDEQVRALATDYIANAKTGTEVLPRSVKLGNVPLWPSIVTAIPVSAVNKKWQLFIASHLNQVDVLVNNVFRKALMWAIFVVVSITAILVSTSIQMIRSRVRMERARHAMLTRELNQARQIQLAWLPKLSMRRGSIDVAAVNTPASHISGDFYNWFDLPDGRLVVTIGDVTGHGMSAAFLMATTQLLVRSTMVRLGDAAKCFQEVNEQLCSLVFNGQFVTMLLCVYDLRAGEVEIVTAGHPAPMFGDGASFQSLDIKPQLVLGVESEAPYSSQRIKLPAESWFLLYTDGVPDCVSPTGERYKLAGLGSGLQKVNGSGSAQSILDTVLANLNQFRGSRALVDDLTLVAVHVKAMADIRS